MKKNNKTLRIVVDVLLIVIGIVFLVFAVKDAYDMYRDSKVTDNVKFLKSYRSVSEDNPYKYTDLKRSKKLIESEAGVLLIGEPNDPWTQVLVKPLEDIVSNYEMDIYYLESIELNKNSKAYKDYPIDLGKCEIPCLVIFKKGEILKQLEKKDIFDSSYDGAPIEYFEKYSKSILEDNLKIISDLK